MHYTATHFQNWKLMRKLLPFILSFIPLLAAAQSLETVFEKSGGKETPTYFQIIEYYKKLDKASPKMLLKTMGRSDAGFPLHLMLVSADANFDPLTWHKQQKTVIFINNGIHPGEPDGIDASMLLLRDIAIGKKQLPSNIALAFIPVYNIGGCLNRSTNYRVDQNGPAAFGFRGNSQNLDLNRDFIKSDSKEARSFAAIFHFLDPDIFVDNHVSNGADYQHVMTLLTSQHNKLGGEMGDFLNNRFEPALYASMKEKGYDLVPYVNFFGERPENGWIQFFDSPRYSSGYATLWNTFAFTPETHMLKAYDQRVQSTYALMECFMAFAAKDNREIKRLRSAAKAYCKTAASFPAGWKPDTSSYATIRFKGYEGGKKPSAVSGLDRLYYDRSKPYEKDIRFYNHFKPSLTLTKPQAYVIPQGWWKVIDLLKLNKVEMRPLSRDTLVDVEVYRIEDYRTAARQYEMHHANSDAVISTTRQQLQFRKGDMYIPMNQLANRFLMEVLEPQNNDSYFAWNFFDAILTQKEGTSNYVFEDTAEEYLKQHPEVKARLEQRRLSDTAFAKSAAAQLDFVFKNSPYYEPDHLRYPVYRVMR
jgi:hypothetical protein